MRDLLDAERLECCARADDIDDRIERANFMKFDFGGVDPMNRSFDLGERLIDGYCTVAGNSRQAGRPNEVEDLLCRPVMMWGVVFMDDDV